MMLTLISLTLLFSALPRDLIVEDSVDIIEFNTLYDEIGRKVFEQVILLDFDFNKRQSFVVVDWRLKSFGYTLTKDINGRPEKPYCLTFIESSSGVTRKVRSEIFRVTNSIGNDPEVQNREILPQERRRKLSKPIIKTARLIDSEIIHGTLR